MHRILKHRPSPATVIACLALSIALGGTSYAAIVLPANSVGTKQLKRAAVTSKKVRDFSLLKRDFKPGQLPAGPQGPPGAQNPNAVDSDLLDGRDSTAFVENAGTIRVSAGLSSWVPVFSTDPLNFVYLRNRTDVTRTAAGESYFRIDAQAPTVLYGKVVRFLGVEICYDTFGSGVTMQQVQVDAPRHTASGLGDINQQIADPTDRTDSACRYYSDPTPDVLTAESGVGVSIGVNWPWPNQALYLGRATFIFEPTSTA
jgi:hypothetical protein